VSLQLFKIEDVTSKNWDFNWPLDVDHQNARNVERLKL